MVNSSLWFMFSKVLQLFFRDYVHGWYYTISTVEGFLYDLRQTLQRALSICKQVSDNYNNSAINVQVIIF